MENEYSDRELEAIRKKVKKWHESFVQSSFYKKLTEDQQWDSEFITNVFAELMYNYFLFLPEDWDEESTIECLVELMPRKITAGIELFENIAPVLNAFFKFLNKNGILAQAKLLADLCLELNNEIVANAMDSDSWGPAKQFSMAAIEAGVDVTNEAEMSAFVLAYNLRKNALKDGIDFDDQGAKENYFLNALENLNLEDEFNPNEGKHFEPHTALSKKYLKYRKASISFNKQLFKAQLDEDNLWKTLDILDIHKEIADFDINEQDVLNDFLIYELYDEKGLNGIEKYAKHHKGRSKIEKELMETYKKTYTSLFKVIGVSAKSDTVTLEDLLYKRKPVTIIDLAFSQQIQSGLFLFTRIIPFKDFNMISGLIFVFGQESEPLLKKHIKKVKHKLTAKNAGIVKFTTFFQFNKKHGFHVLNGLK